MSEILLVGPNGAAGVAKDIPAQQLRLSWYVGEGDSPNALLRDASGHVVDRYPGACPGIATDGPYWLLDLAGMPAPVSAIDLTVEFRVAREAGFEAIVGARTFVHPGAAGLPGQGRLLASLRRESRGWVIIPFDRPADAELPTSPGVQATAIPGDVATHGGSDPGTSADGRTGTFGAPPAHRTDQRDSQARTGRLLLVVDASGSMAPALRTGAVATATMEAIQTVGRPVVLLRGTDGTVGSTRLGAGTLSDDIGRFCEQVGGAARGSRSRVGALLQSVPVEPDDEVVVITDAAPADVAAVRQALGGRNARWFVLGPPSLAEFPSDRRRLEQLAVDGSVRVRLIPTG